MRTVGGGITAPRGFRAAGVACGIKASGALDLALVASDDVASAAAVFTTNKAVAAPVEISREHLAATQGQARALVVNSGCANACTGDAGRRVAQLMAAETARALGCEAEEVLVASTGVIGVALDPRKVTDGIIAAAEALDAQTAENAAAADQGANVKAGGAASGRGASAAAEAPDAQTAENAAAGQRGNASAGGAAASGRTASASAEAAADETAAGGTAGRGAATATSDRLSTAPESPPESRPMSTAMASAASGGSARGSSASGTPASSFVSAAARAIMTTDPFPKEHAVRVEVGGGRAFHIGGIAKGSGMIEPMLATMLGFLTCDAEVPPAVLRRALVEACDTTFNAITVDGECSTNDSVFALANGASGVAIDESRYELLVEGLRAVCLELALGIVRGGEGATKLVSIHVTGARTYDEAKRAARAIANSLLVKTAIHGADPNWGRLIAVAGRCGVAFELAGAKVVIGSTVLFEGGRPFDERAPEAARHLQGKDVRIEVNLGTGGPEDATIWTCDLSAEYVRINAEYRT